jgi:adenine-specific DNA-methyltransferase
VQCIYIDPPYGIKFNSNFQWSTTSRDVRDGNAAHITREPEQVKAFRDTWRDGIHSYLTYLRDRLVIARDLLTESGSIFVQIGDANVHRIRVVLDEVFGEDNFVSNLVFTKTPGLTAEFIASTEDYILWFARNRERLKFRPLLTTKGFGADGSEKYDKALDDSLLAHAVPKDMRSGASQIPPGWKPFRHGDLTSQRQGRDTSELGAMSFRVDVDGSSFAPAKGRGWTTTAGGMDRLKKASRIDVTGANLSYRRFLADFVAFPVTNVWTDVAGIQSRSDPKVYVVQTATKAVERCVLMASDPGDLILDPTCGSGTTATVAEQWARRWITIDTSRVALALARARIMGARYPYFLLADSREGQLKEAEVTRAVSSSQPTHGNIRQGFVYERVPHITLKSIADNAEIDVIWEKWQTRLKSLPETLNAMLKKEWQEWEIPREADPRWPDVARTIHADWWQARIARQREMDASIAAKAEFEYLYDKPYPDNKKVRVAGPFTVESLSPHRVLGVDENDELIDQTSERGAAYAARQTFPQMILENLRTAGVQQAHKDARIVFTALTAWPGDLVAAEGRYMEGEGAAAVERRAAVFLGPEFGTVTRPDLVLAAREAGDAGFDVLIACAFNYEAHATEFNKLGRIPVLKARMNADLHMAEDLKNTGKGNLFVIFGEPDISLLPAEGGRERVKVNGVDVFHPSTGEVRSDGPEGIACWFIDTDYNEESFFVRHAYFLGANDPYGALKTTLKTEINEEAWATLHSDTSRAFDKPKSGRIAVKVINHLGDEVMKVFRVG